MTKRYLYIALLASISLVACEEQKITRLPCDEVTFTPFCSEDGGSLIVCLDGIVQSRACNCVNNVCTMCQTDKQCEPISNATVVCSVDHQCVYSCEEHFALDKEKNICVYDEECREFEGHNNCPSISNASASCSSEFKCEYECFDNYQFNESHTACFFVGVCSSDDDCPDISHGSKSCGINGKCAYSCKPHYQLSSDGTACVFAGECLNDGDCPKVSNGANKCSSEYKCELECIEDYQLNDRGTACFFARQCIDNSQCPVISNASSACDNGSCVFNCDDGYVLNDNKTGCIKYENCGNDYVDSCNDEERRYCRDGIVASEICVLCDAGKCVECTEDDDSNCSSSVEHSSVVCKSSKCSYVCESGFSLNSEDNTCDPVVCTKNEYSACPIPENGRAICTVSDCESPDSNSDEDPSGNGNSMDSCASTGYCDFVCNEGFVKNVGTQTCEAFVCDSERLENCTQGSETREAVCEQNTCTYPCKKGFENKNGACVECENGKCVECTKDDVSQCPHILNASSVSCSDEGQCTFVCDEGCYEKGNNICIPIDKNGNQINDCYEELCNKSDVICIQSIDEFVTILNRIKEGIVSVPGKDDNAAFYLINDINLADAIIVSNHIDKLIAETGKCELDKRDWVPLIVENIKLTTPDSLVKTIYFSRNGIDCTFPDALFDTIKDSEISNITIKFNTKGSASAALANSVINSKLTNVTYAGKIDSTAKEVGGLIKSVVNSSIIDTVCDNATVVSSYPDGLSGCIAARVTKYSMISTGNRINRVKMMMAAGRAACFVGSVDSSTIENSNNECQDIVSYGSAAGFIYSTNNAIIHKINNKVSSEVVVDNNFAGFIRDLKVSSDRRNSQECCVEEIVNEVSGNFAAGKIFAGFVLNSENVLLKNITNTVGKNGSNSLEADKFAGFVFTDINGDVISVDNSVRGMINVKTDAAGFIYESKGLDISTTVSISEIWNKVSGSMYGEGNVAGFVNKATNSKLNQIINDIKSIHGLWTGGLAISVDNSTLGQINNQVGELTAIDEAGGFVHDIKNETVISDVQNNISELRVETNERTKNSNVGGFIAFMHQNSNIERVDSSVDKLSVVSTDRRNYVGGFLARIKESGSSLSDIQSRVFSIDVVQYGKNIDSAVSGFVGKIENTVKMSRILSSSTLNFSKGDNWGIASRFAWLKSSGIVLDDVLLFSENLPSPSHTFYKVEKLELGSLELTNFVDLFAYPNNDRMENSTVSLISSGNSGNVVLNNFYYMPNGIPAEGDSALVEKKNSLLTTHENESRVSLDKALKALNSVNGEAKWSLISYTFGDNVSLELPQFSPTDPGNMPEFSVNSANIPGKH